MTKLSKQILLGPLLGTHRARLIQRCADLVASGEAGSFLYLAASHPLLEVVTREVLDGARNSGIWGELPIYLFRGFVRRILTTSLENGHPLTPRVPIDHEELPLKRSLISQILARLTDEKKLHAIGPLAGREGCINTISTLLGEIQRAGKSPAELSEIIAARVQDLTSSELRPASQIQFDQEVALIYSTYASLLDGNQLTEADADQLRALWLLRDAGSGIEIPWLRTTKLLVLDGFFDFTPIQGEILRHLIPHIPEVVVNLNHDERNPEIFLPFKETIEQLKGIAPFELQISAEESPTRGALSGLRQNLFNPSISEASLSEEGTEQRNIRYLECGDRGTEIQAVAREIKQLVLREDYKLSEIVLVVRQRASYASTIARVMREEHIPCNLETRIDATAVPANRAALKLLGILEELARDENSAPRVSDLADLIKSEYFRLREDRLMELSSQFDREYGHLLSDNGETLESTRIEQLKGRYRIGFWDADALENAFAYVGSDLRVADWLKRAQKLITELPSATATKEILNIDSGAHDRDADVADNVENAETAKLEEKDVEKKRRPSRDIHPSALAWTSLVIQSFATCIGSVPHQGTPRELRRALLSLFDELGFREQTTWPTKGRPDDDELPQLILNFNSLEALRRAFTVAIRSIEIVFPDGVANLSNFVEEVRRAINSQSQLLSAVDRRGLRVLEATDVRGLQFRAVFVVGLVEGGFPLRASRDWIYPHEERERLKRYGLTLEDISPATLLKEEHYFYQSVCRATERLYLTRPLVLEDDSETVASYYVDELRRAIAPLKLEAETVRCDYDGKDLVTVSTASQLSVGLVRQQERYFHHGAKRDLLPQPRIKRLLTVARNDGYVSDAALRRIEIERERAGVSYGPYDGEITEPHLVSLLRQKFGEEFVHSASGLSMYGNCAYRFFAQRVLKLEPRGEAALDLQAIDAGKLLHDILRRFFERYRRQALYKLPHQALREELAEIADKVFDEHERVVPPLNKQIWKIDREIRKILLDQVLLYELEIQEKASGDEVVPAYFEVSFGGTRAAARDPDSIEQPLELTRQTFVGAETIKLSGQIDRVDISRDGKAIAYDYKLSLGSSLQDIRTGRSLQMPIYLEALEKLILPDHEIAGGGYYIIRGGSERRNRGLHRTSQLRYSGIGSRVSAAMSDEEWIQTRADAIAHVWEFIDRIRAGHFAVRPSEREKSCRFCDFAAVCRYDRHRIDLKKV